MTEEEMLQQSENITRRVLDKIYDPEWHILKDEEISDNYLLESPDFKSFDIGLTELMVKKGYTGDISDVNAKYKFLHDCCKKQGISLTPSVVKSWFNDTRPISSSRSRENMYNLCFALKCTLDEVTNFFYYVYFECPFNFRIWKEAVCYFCFSHGLEYSIFLTLCEKAENIFIHENTTGELFYTHTRKIGNALDKLKTQEEMLSYLQANKCEFLIENKTAYDYAEKLIKENTQLAAEIYKSENAELPCSNSRKITQNQNTDLFLLVLFGFDMHEANKNRSFAKESDFPELVSANFISKENISRILSRKKVAYDTLRKNLIILEFFNYYANLRIMAEKHGEVFCCYEEDFDAFIDEVNDLLNSCGYPLLYARNPFDWLIMHCANTADNPLDEFRDAIEAYYRIT